MNKQKNLVTVTTPGGTKVHLAWEGDPRAFCGVGEYGLLDAPLDVTSFRSPLQVFRRWRCQRCARFYPLGEHDHANNL